MRLKRAAIIAVIVTSLMFPQATAYTPSQPPQAPISRSGKPEGPASKPPPQPRLIYDGIAELTAYTGTDAGERGDDIAADGTRCVPWLTVAAWPGVPFGSTVEIPALGRKFIVHDRGGAITAGHIDIYVGHSNVAEVMEFGRQQARIKIYAPPN